MKTALHSNRALCGTMALVVFAWLAQVPSANAVNILFHGRTATAGNSDAQVIAHLDSRYGAGSVDYVDLDGVVVAPGATGAGYDLIVLSESISSSSVRDGAYANTPVPIINWENALPHTPDGRFQMTEGKGTVDATDITIEKPASPLAAGLSGTVAMFTAGAEKLQYGKGPVCDGCDLVASIAAVDEIDQDDVGNAIFAVDTGGALLGDDFMVNDVNVAPSIAPARRVMFPMWNNSFPFLTADGIALFDASTDWLLDLGGTAENGDYDDSGAVGQGDLDLVLLNWGDEVPPAPVPAGWVNQQPAGVIGQSALDGVLLNWGNGTSTIAVVPEPTSILLLGIAGALCSLRRR